MNDLTLPHDDEAERAVLGCMLRDPSIVPAIRLLLHRTDFYRRSHRRLYEAIEHLHDQGTEPNFANVIGYLRAVEVADEEDPS